MTKDVELNSNPNTASIVQANFSSRNLSSDPSFDHGVGCGSSVKSRQLRLDVNTGHRPWNNFSHSDAVRSPGQRSGSVQAESWFAEPTGSRQGVSPKGLLMRLVHRKASGARTLADDCQSQRAVASHSGAQSQACGGEAYPDLLLWFHRAVRVNRADVPRRVVHRVSSMFSRF